MIQERKALQISGIGPVVILLVILLGLGWWVRQGMVANDPDSLWALAVVPFVLLALNGFIIVNPNEAGVAIVFGRYIGSIKEDGFWWTNPFSVKRKISLKVRNFESGKMKVNDKEGNPVEIAAIVVWKVVETAEAVFNVESYENYVQVQSEAAVRNLASSYPYDSQSDKVLSLRGSTHEVAEQMKTEVQERLSKAGVEVIEARISHLAYAPEIASAMLRRQQANAIIAARQRIVEGAVSMVEMALDKLEAGGKVQLDEERKATMVSNLLVVLTSDRDAQPVVNTGTLYQ